MVGTSAEPGARGVGQRADSLIDTKARAANLDILRAIAAIMVLLCHAYAFGGRFIVITPDGSTAQGTIFSARWTIDALVDFGASGVWLFFALSGYLISKPFVRSLVTGEPMPAIVPYAIRRAARIFPLYWVALTATFVILGVSVTQRRYVPFHYALLQNVVPGEQAKVLGIAWTLTLELLFYAAVPLLALLAVRMAKGRPIRPGRLATGVAVLWIASILWTAVAAGYGVPLHRLWLRGLLPSMFGMFCPGILLAIAEHDLSPSRWRWWLQKAVYHPLALVVAGACLFSAAIISSGVRPGRNPGPAFFVAYDSARPLYAVGYGIVLAWAIRSRPWGGRFRAPLVELGLISYGIYLIHAVWSYALLTTDWGRDLIPMYRGGAVAYLVHALFLLALTVPLAWLSWRFLERPILRWAIKLGDELQARRVGRGKKTPSAAAD